MSDTYTAAMGLSFTFLSLYFLQKEYDFKLSVSDKWIIMAFPILFIFALYFTLFDYGYFKIRVFDFVTLYQILFYLHIINPVTIAFLGMVLALTRLKDLANPRNLFIFSSITIFYAYFFMFTWKNSWIGGRRSSFDTEITQDNKNQVKDEFAINYDVNLADFSFINASLDTVSLLDGSNKYILLETWAETCPPCVKAMHELPNFYRSIEDKVSVYYVYEHRKLTVRNKFERIFSFKEIEDKSKILVDIDQALYHALNMQGYPYFLIFDQKGDLLHFIRGYGDKDRIIAQISEYIPSSANGLPRK